MTDFKVEFGRPSNGWLSVCVESASGRSQQDVSDVPGDTLSELARALTRLASSSSHEEIEWALEPELWLWRFTADDDHLQLSITVLEETVEHWVPKRLALRQFCSSLLKLGQDPAWSRDDAMSTAWSWEFPHRNVAELSEVTVDA